MWDLRRTKCTHKQSINRLINTESKHGYQKGEWVNGRMVTRMEWVKQMKGSGKYRLPVMG